MWPFSEKVRLSAVTRREISKIGKLGDVAQVLLGAPVLDAAETSKVVQVLEAALDDEPHEFIFMFYLCDAYLSAERYLEALVLAERMAGEWADDPRSIYVLASVYHSLGRDRREEMSSEQLAVIEAALAEQGESLESALEVGPSLSPFAPPKVDKACEDAGLSVEEVRARAVHYFEETLGSDLHAEDAAIVNQTLHFAEGRLERTRQNSIARVQIVVRGIPKPGKSRRSRRRRRRKSESTRSLE